MSDCHLFELSRRGSMRDRVRATVAKWLKVNNDKVKTWGPAVWHIE